DGADDGEIMVLVGGGDLGQFVRHARAAGDSGDEAAGPLQHAVEHALGAAHLPQHVDIDRSLDAGDVIGLLDLGAGAVDGVVDQLLVPLAPGQRVVDLGDDPAFRIVAVRIDRGDGADAARRRPGAGACVVGGRYAFAAFDQRQHFTARIADRPDTLEHHSST